MTRDEAVIELIEGPAPAEDSSGMSLDDALRLRRSQRDFGPVALSPAELSALLWAAQGATAGDEKRTAPSAGNLHPLVLHVVTSTGLFRYVAETGQLELVASGDRRARIASACLDQMFLADAAALFVIANNRRLSHDRYGGRAERYAMLEAGHVAQNLLLEATALGLAAVPIGAFYDAEVRELAGFAKGLEPLYVIGVGHPKAEG